MTILDTAAAVAFLNEYLDALDADADFRGNLEDRLRDAVRAVLGERAAMAAELEQLRARLGESQRRPGATTVWAIAWDRDDGTTYSFPIESEKYARDGIADLVRSGVTGMRLVVNRDGKGWRDVAHTAEGDDDA